MKENVKQIFLGIVGMLIGLSSYSQAVPAKYENIPFLVTFGKDAEQKWGDDDKSQTFFFAIPANQTTPFYIRVFDPDCGGQHDENKGGFNTQTSFTILGGESCYSTNDNENRNPVGNYKKGNMLAFKNFGASTKYDNKWYTFGPFNPKEGANKPELGGYVFKVIADGVSGDDGNLYRYFLSSSPTSNIPLEGGNAFTFEYSFRLPAPEKSVSHIYPFVDNNVLSIKQFNFDFDDDAYIRILSASKNGLKVKTSNDSEWANDENIITDDERNTSLDIQMVKYGNQRNNNVVFYITNQYGKFLPFYTVPIGGMPKYKYKIKMTR